MTSIKEVENEPTVGNNFFENVPPVEKSDEFQITTDLVETSNHQRSGEVTGTQGTTVLKGFGGNALFVLGLLAKTKEAGERVRLDDDTGNKEKLSNAEDIFRRNLIIVRKYYNVEGCIVTKNNGRIEEYDKPVPLALADEVFASDYVVKTRSLGKKRK
jgi:hypothetical protein